MNVRAWWYSTTSIRHAIDPEVHERWLREHRMQLFYLPPYSPELNLIEIVWK
ncbi:transposase [Caballeronia sordidicola]|uniref:transposase n=1 Tax=Caballeronia sordidicola TaxID=196367 RepID=UPI0009DDD5E8